MIKQYKLKSNGSFCILKDPYEKKQHTNQQNGLNLYVDVVDFYTGVVNCVKLYENTKGLHFKKSGSHYLKDFKKECVYVPLQIIELEK